MQKAISCVLSIVFLSGVLTLTSPKKIEVAPSVFQANFLDDIMDAIGGGDFDFDEILDKIKEALGL